MEHALDFVDLVVELPIHLGLQVAEVMSEQKLIFGLAGRTCGDAEEVGELSLAFAAAALRNAAETANS